MHALSALRRTSASTVFRYLEIIRFKITRMLVFRTEMAIWIVLSCLPFAILFLIWQELFAGQSIVNGYSLSDITSYYLISLFLMNLTEVHFEGWRSEEVRLGRIDRFFTKPFDYITEIVLGESVGKLLYGLLFLPVFGAFTVLAVHTVGATLPQLSLISILSFICLALVAYTIQLCFGMLITFLTFWFEGAQGLEHFKMLTITLLSGTLMPLEFLPDWLQTLTNLLPFKYLYAVPIGVLQGKYTIQTVDAAHILFTVGMLIGAVRLVWYQGVRM